MVINRKRTVNLWVIYLELWKGIVNYVSPVIMLSLTYIYRRLRLVWLMFVGYLVSVYSSCINDNLADYRLFNAREQQLYIFLRDLSLTRSSALRSHCDKLLNLYS